MHHVSYRLLEVLHSLQNITIFLPPPPTPNPNPVPSPSTQHVDGPFLLVRFMHFPICVHYYTAVTTELFMYLPFCPLLYSGDS